MTYPQILVLFENDYNRYFLIRSEDELYQVAFDILKERYDEQSWYDSEHPEFDDIKAAVKSKDKKAAWKLLRRRTQYEYESLELTSPEN